MRCGTHGQPAGALLHQGQKREEEVQDELLRAQLGGDRPAVRAHSALLGCGHRAGLQLAVWRRHVQNHPVGHSDEHVRQRVFPHCHECDPLLLGGLGSEEQNRAPLLLHEVDLRDYLDTGDCGNCAHVDFLNRQQRNRRETLSAAVSRGSVLAGSLSHSENSCRFRVADVHRVHQLHHAAAVRPQPEYENKQPQTEISSYKIHHYCRAVLLRVLDAEPRHHFVERAGQTERCKLGQSVLHSAHIRVPADRVSGAHQQLPEPDYLLPHEEGVQKQTEGSDTQRIVCVFGVY